MEEGEEETPKEIVMHQRHNSELYCLDHHIKNPFSKPPNKLRNSGTVPKVIIKEDCDQDQPTSRMGWTSIIRPNSKPLVTIKHCSTAPPTESTSKSVVEPATSSTFAPSKPQSVREPESEIKIIEKEEAKKPPIHEITDDEFDLFACVLKDRINLPTFVREQFKVISSLPPASPAILEKLSTKLVPPQKKKLSNKTVVLDLDNTLVYVVTNQTYAKLNLPKQMDVRTAVYTEPKEGRAMSLNIIVRPYALEMLKQLSVYYEIIVFTAANKVYGDAVINVLDPAGTLIDHRLYRDSCIKENSTYIKDLRIINRDLSSMIIVDDSIASFSNQMENGILISPFTGNVHDAELGVLWIFLRQIIATSDVRVPIIAKYNLPFLYKMYRKTMTKD